MKALFLAALFASTASFAIANHGDKANNDKGVAQVCSATGQYCP